MLFPGTLPRHEIDGAQKAYDIDNRGSLSGIIEIIESPCIARYRELFDMRFAGGVIFLRFFGRCGAVFVYSPDALGRGEDQLIDGCARRFQDAAYAESAGVAVFQVFVFDKTVGTEKGVPDF